MNYNINSGYGKAVLNAAPALSLSGKTFIVGKSALPNRDMVMQVFGPDADGRVRYAATVDAAMGLCTAGAGDIIYVLPGHTETVTATSIAHDVSGVSVIGLGQGALRPTFTFSTAAATITVTAPNGMWKNCVFVANFADVAAAFTLGATSTDFQLVGNDFIETGTDLNWFNILVTGATNNASDGLTIIGNYVHQQDAAAKAPWSVLGNLSRLTINDNTVINNSTVDASQFLTLSSKVILGARIYNNKLAIVGASHAINVGAFITGSSTTSSGVVADNYVGCINSATMLLATTGQGFVYFNNLTTKIADKSGLVLPAIS